MYIENRNILDEIMDITKDSKIGKYGGEPNTIKLVRRTGYLGFLKFFGYLSGDVNLNQCRIRTLRDLVIPTDFSGTIVLDGNRISDLKDFNLPKNFVGRIYMENNHIYSLKNLNLLYKNFSGVLDFSSNPVSTFDGLVLSEDFAGKIVINSDLGHIGEINKNNYLDYVHKE